MKQFVLDTNPNFSDATAKVGDFTYRLAMIKGNGCRITVFQTIGKEVVERDSLHLTRDDMRAFFMMLCSNCKD